jgi:hypothetical protein
MTLVKRVSILTILVTSLLVTQASLLAQRADQPPRSVLGVDCSRIAELGIDKQTNMRAAMIRVGCGVEQPGTAGPALAEPVLGPLGAATNVNTITGPEIFPNVTQSESMVWSNDGNTIVVHYNDSRERSASPIIIAGLSVSTDGGATFTRLSPSPLRGHGNNFGDPIVVYNAKLAQWFAGDLASGCGGQGIGLWTSPDGINWSVGACAHSGNNDDRESMWVDNNPGSPFYGRMYISWNNFALGARLFVTFSDDGVSWSAPVALTSGFIRDVQLTGSPGTDGTVFVAGMDEGGGGFNNRINLMYRSIDGGSTWTETVMGSPFAPPGDSVCSNPYFARIFPIWRHMGWGQPGVGPNFVVHYAYAGRGLNPGDTGDIYYTQSTDDGLTWLTPLVLNSDQALDGTGAQWMPSLSVSASGSVQVSWYDRRNTTDGTNYERWGIHSPDNGLTWEPDMPISDVLIPQPEQPDPGIQACYAGDYDYATAFGETHYVTWTDGRNPVSGRFQQDVYFATVPAAGGASFTLTASPDTVNAGEPLTIQWTAPPGRPSTDWIGLYRVGDPNTAYGWWAYTNGATSGSFLLNAPDDPGAYEFRYLLEDGYTDAARSNTVTVGGPAGFTLTASPDTVNPGDPLTIQWTAPPGRPPTDWIGLYRVGDPNTAYGWWAYTNGATSGSFLLNAPDDPGTYEFRYLVNDGYTDVARSNAVTVQ